MINGINTLLVGVDPFRLSRQTLTRAELLARAQTRLDAAIATKNARIALHNAVEAERLAASDFKPIRSSFRSYLVAIYGANAPELQQYGYVQSRRPKRTVKAKSTAVAKAQATRQARGTKGKKQKAQIHGTVPVTAPAAPSAPPVASPSGGTTAPVTTPPPVAAAPAHAPAGNGSPSAGAAS